MRIKPIIIVIVEKNRSIRHRSVLITGIHDISYCSFWNFIPYIREMSHYCGKMIGKHHYLCVFFIKDIVYYFAGLSISSTVLMSLHPRSSRSKIVPSGPIRMIIGMPSNPYSFIGVCPVSII